jgi:hypothetical protein
MAETAISTDAQPKTIPSAIRRRVEQVFLASAGAYPFLLVGALYLTYFVAWGALGHAPVPNIDDPKYIGVLVDLPYVLTMALMMGAPAAMFLGVVLLPLVLTRRTGAWRLGFALALAAVWIWAALFLCADQWDVGTWYVD